MNSRKTLPITWVNMRGFILASSLGGMLFAALLLMKGLKQSYVNYQD